MSERYNVEVEDVLGENYKITNIECSDYNPTIDGNITVTIVAKVLLLLRVKEHSHN